MKKLFLKFENINTYKKIKTPFLIKFSCYYFVSGANGLVVFKLLSVGSRRENQ